MNRSFQAGAGGSPSAPRAWPCRGFTLVELMITLTVAVILIMIAVPSFRNITLSNKLTTTANDIVGAINMARMEAIKRNANTQLCSDLAASNTSDPLGTACTTQTGSVWEMNNTVATQVSTGPVSLVDPLQLSGHMTALRFGGQGLGYQVGTTAPYTGLVADICTSLISSDNHRQINLTAGSIVTVSNASGACP